MEEYSLSPSADKILSELIRRENYTINPPEFFDVKSMNLIIKAFDKAYSIKNLIKKDFKYSGTGWYEYDDINYLFKAKKCHQISQNGFTDYLIVRLSNNQYWYSNLNRVTMVNKVVVDGNDYETPSSEFLKKKMNYLNELKKEFNANIKFAYSIEHKRFNILFRDSRSNKIILKLCFKAGNPENYVNNKWFTINHSGKNKK